MTNTKEKLQKIREALKLSKINSNIVCNDAAKLLIKAGWDFKSDECHHDFVAKKVLEAIALIDSIIRKENVKMNKEYTGSIEKGTLTMEIKPSKPSVYMCPKHKKITATIAICGETFKDLQGNYCTMCCIEKLIELGVHKVTRIEDK